MGNLLILACDTDISHTTDQCLFLQAGDWSSGARLPEVGDQEFERGDGTGNRKRNRNCGCNLWYSSHKCLWGKVKIKFSPCLTKFDAMKTYSVLN